MESKPKLIVVCGPTSTGKSAFAVTLAKKINGEIISADSRQVYRGFDIGSGKITHKEMDGVPHHMLSIASPKRTFSVEQFKKKGKICIEKIINKNKTPIICGGTSFYIDALLGFEFPQVKPNKILRQKLVTYKTEELAIHLKKLDEKRYATIDKKNRVRLIRAIEIATEIGYVPKLKQTTTYQVTWFGIDKPDEILKHNIETRLHKRLKQGMVQEVRKLHETGLPWSKLEAFGLEYKHIALYLQKKISKEEMVAQIKTTSWQYVKRQRTWLKKNNRIQWIDTKI